LKIDKRNMAAIYRCRRHAELNSQASTQGCNTLRLTYAHSHGRYRKKFDTGRILIHSTSIGTVRIVLKCVYNNCRCISMPPVYVCAAPRHRILRHSGVRAKYSNCHSFVGLVLDQCWRITGPRVYRTPYSPHDHHDEQWSPSHPTSSLLHQGKHTSPDSLQIKPECCFVVCGVYTVAVDIYRRWLAARGISRLVHCTLLGTSTIIQCYPLVRAFLYPPLEDAHGCQHGPARCLQKSECKHSSKNIYIFM